MAKAVISPPTFVVPCSWSPATLAQFRLVSFPQRSSLILNNRYTKYELRLLTVLANKPVVLASGEIEAMGLLTDGLIENAKTFETQSITITDNTTGEMVHTDHFVQSFAARLTPKGRKFIEVWKSSSDNLLDQL